MLGLGGLFGAVEGMIPQAAQVKSLQSNALALLLHATSPVKFENGSRSRILTVERMTCRVNESHVTATPHVLTAEGERGRKVKTTCRLEN